MEERLNKVIAHAGVASRRGADQLIADGLVTVNGKLVLEPARRVDPEKDHIKVDGKLLRTRSTQRHYILLNKPRGFVCDARDDEGQHRPHLGPLLSALKTRVTPIDRLDWDAEGLVLFTNDGGLVQTLSDTQSGIPRTWLVKIKGLPDERLLQRLRTGVPLPDGRSLPIKVRVVTQTTGNAWLQLVVREVRTHLLKRIFFKLGHPVLKLKRTGWGSFTLQGLPVGAFRWLSAEESRALKALARELPGLADLREAARDEDLDDVDDGAEEEFYDTPTEADSEDI